MVLTCPKCNAPQTVTDADAGKTVRCATCHAEFPTDSGPVPPSPEAAPPKSRAVPIIIGLAVLGGAALAAYLAFWRATPTDVGDPNGLFTARFPDAPEVSTISVADPIVLKWGEQLYRTRAGGKEYAVAVLDGINAGDQDYGPQSRDTQANDALVIFLTNENGKKLAERTVDHEGHVAREMAFVRREDGRLTAARVITGEHQILRLSVTGSGDKDKPAEFLDQAADFFNQVHVGPGLGPPILEAPPAMTAAELAAAYKADSKAADARYKDHWVRVSGQVREAAKDGTSFELAAGDGAVTVRRAPPARVSIRLPKSGGTVAATGKCRGLDAESGHIVLDEAIVINPARAKQPERQ
jgi:predicted Zn finger-like uncharacterized protein